jgi:hypothetical protein
MLREHDGFAMLGLGPSWDEESGMNSNELIYYLCELEHNIEELVSPLPGRKCRHPVAMESDTSLAETPELIGSGLARSGLFCGSRLSAD